MDSRVLTQQGFDQKNVETYLFDDAIKAPNLISTICVDGFYGSKKITVSCVNCYLIWS